MSETTGKRAAIAATLRALADLLDDESIPEPHVSDAVFWIRNTPDNAATAARIMKALGGTWSSQQRNWGGSGDYLELTGHMHGVGKVDIEVPVEDAGRETGSRVVKEYEPVPVIAELLDTATQPGPDTGEDSQR